MPSEDEIKERTEYTLRVLAAICSQYARAVYLSITLSQFEASIFAGFDVEISPVEKRSRAALHAATRTEREHAEWTLSTLKYISHRVLVHEKMCQDTFEDLVRISTAFELMFDSSLKRNGQIFDSVATELTADAPAAPPGPTQ